MKTKIINAKIVSPYDVLDGSILIEDEKIVNVAHEIEDPAEKIIDAEGQYVFPGFIDAHTHFEMPSGDSETADSFETGTKAAVFGGTTTIINFADQKKGGSLHDILSEYKKKASGNCFSDYRFHVSICDWNERTKAELYQMADLGVHSYKAYLAYDNSRLKDGELFQVLKVMKELQTVIGVHCENGDLVNEQVKYYIENGCTSPYYHPLSRPAEVEAEAISRLLYLASLAHATVNIVHLSTALGLKEIEKVRSRGQKVFVETCPHYLLLDDSKYSLPDFESAKYVCSPPLRKKSDVSALWNAVQNGEIQTISTDHCSFNFNGQKTKGLNDFSKIPNGMPGTENRPELIYTYGVSSGKIDVKMMCALLSTNASKIYKLYPRKGIIAKGSDADLVIWGKRKSIISAKDQLQNVDYNPYEGTESLGHARYVFLRGNKMVDNYKFVGEKTGIFV